MAQDGIAPGALPCGKAGCATPRAPGKARCEHHYRQEMAALTRRIERMRANAAWDTFNMALDRLERTRDAIDVRAYFARARDAHLITPEFYLGYLPFLEEEIEFWAIPRAEEGKEWGELHQLAVDHQSVHTAPVNRQSQQCLDLLLDHVPVIESVIPEIAEAWSNKHHMARTAVVKDMKRWYRTDMCREKEDYLYKRALDGLWSRIRVSPAKADLVERLWEECYESLNMCCEGHISRLCNVMCGFDEAFKAPVSVGELLQQRMALIAEKEVDDLEKIAEAWEIMEDLAVPMDARDAWLEAF